MNDIVRRCCPRKPPTRSVVVYWADIKQDLKALEEVVIEDNGRSLALRTQCTGTCGKLFQAVGVAVPPTIRDV